jgi:hypothetical protein
MVDDDDAGGRLVRSTARCRHGCLALHARVSLTEAA